QLPALVHDVVVLFARHAPQLAGGRAARPCAAGQVAADLLGAAAQVVAGGAGSLPECIAAIARGLLQGVAGFGQVFLQLLTSRRSRRAPGSAGGGRVAAGGGRSGCAHLGTGPVHVWEAGLGCGWAGGESGGRSCHCIGMSTRRLPRTICSANCGGDRVKPVRKPPRSANGPELDAITTSPGRRPLRAARLSLATSSTSTPLRPACRSRSGSSAKLAPASRGSSSAPAIAPGWASRVVVTVR